MQLARHFNSSIISADSRQCFKELGIGVAKPNNAQLNEIPHYFINSHSITEEVNAGVFETYALSVAENLFRYHDIVVMTGGTGLYIRAFCEGIDMIPVIDKQVREEVIAGYHQQGLPWLHQQLQQHDPGWAATGEILNPQRAMRALEVVLQTGQSIRTFHTEKKIERPFNIIKLGLTLPRPQLYAQINQRVDHMIAEGLEEEVRALQPFSSLNALQTVGYSEMFDYFNGLLSREQAIEDIKKHTRHYAKRQLTWFAKDAGISWFSPLDYSQLINYLLKLV